MSPTEMHLLSDSQGCVCCNFQGRCNANNTDHVVTDWQLTCLFSPSSLSKNKSLSSLTDGSSSFADTCLLSCCGRTSAWLTSDASRLLVNRGLRFKFAALSLPRTKPADKHLSKLRLQFFDDSNASENLNVSWNAKTKCSPYAKVWFFFYESLHLCLFKCLLNEWTRAYRWIHQLWALLQSPCQILSQEWMDFYLSLSPDQFLQYQDDLCLLLLLESHRPCLQEIPNLTMANYIDIDKKCINMGQGIW